MPPRSPLLYISPLPIRHISHAISTGEAAIGKSPNCEAISYRTEGWNGVSSETFAIISVASGNASFPCSTNGPLFQKISLSLVLCCKFASIESIDRKEPSEGMK